MNALISSSLLRPELRVGGLTPFSSIDCPGRLAAVVFAQGCPWRCSYCQNPHLQPRHAHGAAAAAAPGWAGLRPWLQRRVGLIDMVVFSGGEPTTDPGLPAAMAEVRALGYDVGLHTAGVAPKRLQGVLPLADWVGLDIKAPLSDEAAHARITGVHGASAVVRQSLAALVASGVAHECRTTIHPDLLDDAALLRLADELSTAGARHWALQVFRTTGCRGTLAAVGDGYPAPDTLSQLRERFPALVVRRD